MKAYLCFLGGSSSGVNLHQHFYWRGLGSHSAGFCFPGVLFLAWDFLSLAFLSLCSPHVPAFSKVKRAEVFQGARKSSLAFSGKCQSKEGQGKSL